MGELSESSMRQMNTPPPPVPVAEQPAASAQEGVGDRSKKNLIVEGVNKLLSEIPDLAKEGKLSRIEYQVERLKNAIKLAQQYGVGMMSEEELLTSVEQAKREHLPSAIETLVASGADSVRSGTISILSFHRERLQAVMPYLRKEDFPGGKDPLEEFDRQVKLAIPEAAKSIQDAVARLLDGGELSLVQFNLKKVEDLKELAKASGVDLDSNSINEQILGTLKTKAAGALVKAIDKITELVENGSIQNVPIKEEQIARFLGLLKEKGIPSNIAEADIGGLIQEKVRAGLQEGLKSKKEDVYTSIRYGNPGAFQRRVDQVMNYLSLARASGMDVPSDDEVRAEVLVGATAIYSQAMRGIIGQLQYDLQNGSFGFNSTVVEQAHKTADDLYAFAVVAGIPVSDSEKKLFHRLIDVTPTVGVKEK